MKKVSTYLLVILMIFFWVSRIIITISSELGKDFMGVQPINEKYEIIILFATLVCVILVAKRKMLGGLLYLTIHTLYYGADITDKLAIISRGEQLSLNQSSDLFFSIVGIILPLAVLLDLLLDQSRKDNPRDKKTDWFYKNEQFDRKLDDRADKNNYRTL